MPRGRKSYNLYQRLYLSPTVVPSIHLVTKFPLISVESCLLPQPVRVYFSRKQSEELPDFIYYLLFGMKRRAIIWPCLSECQVCLLPMIRKYHWKKRITLHTGGASISLLLALNLLWILTFAPCCEIQFFLLWTWSKTHQSLCEFEWVDLASWL